VECFPGEQTEFKINTVANRQPVKIAKADVVCETVNILEVQGFGCNTSMGIPRL